MSLKVALIEDDADIRNMYSTKLAEEGFEVRAAADGSTGLELVDSFHPDVILLDVILPDLNGIDFLGKIRSARSHDHIKIIILTNLDDPSLHESFKMMNISDYLVKADTTPAGVVEKIRALS